MHVEGQRAEVAVGVRVACIGRAVASEAAWLRMCSFSIKSLKVDVSTCVSLCA